MSRWTPIVYTNCKRCTCRRCTIARQGGRGQAADRGTAIPVVVRDGAGSPAGVPIPVQAGPGAPAIRAGAPPRRLDLGGALPFILLGVAALLIASLETRTR